MDTLLLNGACCPNQVSHETVGRRSTNIVRLEPDLAKVFPTDEAVNEALRTVVRASRAPRRSTRLPNKELKLTKRG